MDPKYPKISVKLLGNSGNAFFILGKVTKELRRAQVPTDQIEAFKAEAMSGDYDHLLQTVMKWVTVD
jgi:hypothetical protein